MSYCINPVCPAPNKNSSTTNFCISCGSKILLKDRYLVQQFIDGLDLEREVAIKGTFNQQAQSFPNLAGCR